MWNLAQRAKNLASTLLEDDNDKEHVANGASQLDRSDRDSWIDTSGSNAARVRHRAAGNSSLAGAGSSSGTSSAPGVDLPHSRYASSDGTGIMPSGGMPDHEPEEKLHGRDYTSTPSSVPPPSAHRPAFGMGMGMGMLSSLSTATSVLQKVAGHVSGAAEVPSARQQSQLDTLKAQLLETVRENDALSNQVLELQRQVTHQQQQQQQAGEKQAGEQQGAGSVQSGAGVRGAGARLHQELSQERAGRAAADRKLAQVTAELEAAAAGLAERDSFWLQELERERAAAVSRSTQQLVLKVQQLEEELEVSQQQHAALTQQLQACQQQLRRGGRGGRGGPYAGDGGRARNGDRNGDRSERPPRAEGRPGSGFSQAPHPQTGAPAHDRSGSRPRREEAPPPQPVAPAAAAAAAAGQD